MYFESNRMNKLQHFFRRFFRASVGLCLFAAATLCNKGIAEAVPVPQDNKQQQEESGDPRSLEFNEKGVASLKAKNFSQAEDLFRRSLNADPKNLTAAFNLSSLLLTQKREREAIDILEKYTEAYDKDSGLFVRLGDAYFSTKEPDKALGAYEKAFAIDPAFPGLAQKLASVYALRNRPKDSERMLLLAVEQDPKDGAALASLSAMFLANGKSQQAISTAKRALQVKPSSEVYITLGTAYEFQRDYKNSLIAFKRARDLGDKRAELDKKIAFLEEQSKKSPSETQTKS